MQAVTTNRHAFVGREASGGFDQLISFEQFLN
jgi:hypothetical protein